MKLSIDKFSEAALGSSTLWNQVYLTSRWVLCLGEQRSVELAYSANRIFNEKPCISHEELQIILEAVMTENEMTENSKKQEIQQPNSTAQECIDECNGLAKNVGCKTILEQGMENSREAMRQILDSPLLSLSGRRVEFAGQDSLTVQMTIKRPTQINHLDFSGYGEPLVSLAIVNPAESTPSSENDQLLEALEIARSALMEIADISESDRINTIIDGALTQVGRILAKRNGQQEDAAK